MCDTLVALGNTTADGSVILAKNSDREPNEAQALTYVPRARHAPGSKVQCTYVEIPQVPETHEALLCKPFWMWGAEMGVNEHAVAIGNEAVFTRLPYGKEPGLIGMDMLRLALERGSTARQALDIIVELLETYGQSGNCGYRHKTYYHNSFLIADPLEAWVLETVGSLWAAERVRDVRTISNALTIGPRQDLASADLSVYAERRGWTFGKAGIDMARVYSSPLMTRLDGSQARQPRSTGLLRAERGRIAVPSLMSALRDHGQAAAEGRRWDPGRGWLMDTICVHASLGPARPSQTVGSMVAHLTASGPVAWVTGTSAPCTGIFKPVYLGGAGLPDVGPEPAANPDAGSIWWAHERLHRAVIRDFSERLALYSAERDALEADFLSQAGRVGSAADDRREFTRSCFECASQATVRWTAAVASHPVRRRPSRLFSMAWDRFDREALPSPGPSRGAAPE